MKISIWIKEDDVEVAHDLIESGLFTTSGVLPIELLINFEAFIKLRHNFELV